MNRRLISEESEQLIGKTNCFDAIRYYLSIIVVLSHFYIIMGSGELDWITNSGQAVSGFFVLSGFLVFYSFYRKPNLKTYIKTRARRLIPPYLFIICLCLVIGMVMTTLPLGDFLTSSQLYKYLVANLSFMNFIEPCMPGVFESNALPTINGSLWTMKVEIMLYATVPITYFFFKRYNKAVVLAVIFALSIAYSQVFLWLYSNTGKAIYEIMHRQIGTQLIYFYSGTAILFYFDWFQRHIKILLPTALILYVVLYKVPGLDILSPFVFAVLIIGIAYNFKYLNFLGRFDNVSYGLYLFHFPIIQVVAACRLQDISIWLALAVSLVAITAVSYFSWYVIENPILKKK